MATFNLYNIAGEKIGTVEQPALFETPVDQKLIHRYLTWVRTMLRHTLSDTKTRGEVRGGGKKPWRQKGTGRARVGSSRSPIWRKGGTVFGPLKARNWATRLPRTERRKALFSALAAKAKADNIIVLDAWIMEAPKTQEAAAVLAKLPIEAGKKILHISPEVNANLFRSTRNLPGVTSKTVAAANIIDILNHDVIVLTKDGLERLETHFSPTL
ncbi:MAG: 50S ribosomal protein L4 [bacterium]